MIKKLLRILLLFILQIQIAIAADDQFALAMKLKVEQRFDDALSELEIILIREPLNISALEQKALMLSWTQRFPESIETWRKLIALEPNNEKLQLGLGRVLFWNGELKRSRYYLATVVKNNPKNKEARELYQKVLQAKSKISTRYRLDVGGASDTFSEVREKEGSSFLQLGFKVDADTNIFIRYDNQYQFKSTDEALGFGIYYKIDPEFLLNADYTQSLKKANFRANTMLNLGVENYSLSPVVLSLSYRALSYDSGSVSTIQPGIAFSWKALTLAAKYGVSQNSDKTSTSSSQVKIIYAITEFTSVSVGYASGDEALPPLAKAKVVYLPVGVQHQFDDQHRVRLDYVLEDRANTYKHQSIGLSYAFKF